MRKLLLSTILLVAMVATSFAQSTEPITINLLTNSSASTWSGDASGFSTTMDGFSMEYLKASSTSNCIAPSADHIRLYKNSQFKISNVAGCPITKLVFTVTGSSYVVDTKPNSGTVTLNSSQLQIIWTADSDNDVSAIIFNNSEGQIRVKSIDVTYLDTPPAVAVPTFTPDGGNVMEKQTVSIACATEGASIYYTTNGDVPTTASTLYTGPFDITESCIIKAIAAKGEDVSELGEAEFFFPVVVTNLADFIALDDDTFTKINVELAVAYQNGQRLFVTDGTNYTLIFGTLGITYANGDRIPAGVVGVKTTMSYGVIELASPETSTFQAGVAGEPVLPVTVDATSVTADLQNFYVKIEGLTYKAGNGSNGTLSDGTNSFASYNQFNVTVPTDATVKYDVVGIITVYNSPQLYPLSFTESTGTGIAGVETATATIVGGFSQVEINTVDNAEVLIVNTLGQAVASKNITAGTTTIGVAPGLYIVKVGQQTTKVVVK